MKPSITPRPKWGRVALSAIVCSVILAGYWSALDATPAFGTVIGNQAAATYTDGSLQNRTVTSNTVNTVVQQVAALTLISTQSRTGAPGGTVYFPHTLTNTGNGPDTFNLTAPDPAGGITYTSLVMYADADGNGVPDNATPITVTTLLQAGGTFSFVVAATIPAGTSSGTTDTITVTGISQFDGSKTAANVDTLNVSNNGVINVTKSISAPSGKAGTGPYTYTLTYTNTGNTTATNIIFYDKIPTGMTYYDATNDGSGTGNYARWSGNSGTALTDADKTDNQGGIIYDYNITTPGSKALTAVVTSLAPGNTSTITFKVLVDAGIVPQTIHNTPQFCYNNGVAVVPDAACTSSNVGTKGSNGNTVDFQVLQTAGVIALDTGTNSGSWPDTDGAINDFATVASAPQGATVPFENVITNTGTGTDTFDITINSNNFPVGTTFLLFKSDGTTPLLDTNSNSIPDTGPLAAGANYHVIMKAILPTSAVGGPFTAVKRATSGFDPSVHDDVNDTLTTITPNSVDLTNNLALDTGSCSHTTNGNVIGGCGAQAGTSGDPAVTTNAANPGSTSIFKLYVNNTSGVSDSYGLLASPTSTFPGSMPTGWSVVFRLDGGAGTCATTGAAVTDTGVINAGANELICAIVTLPANAVAGTQAVWFNVASPNTGVSDIKHDAVSVNTVRSIQVASNNARQVYPGGSTVYTNTVTNNGNVLEGSSADASGSLDGTNSFVALTDPNSRSGWTSVVYWDINNDGQLDAGDPVVTDLSQLTGGTNGASTAAGLAPGESARLFVKVFAPASAAAGDTDVTTLTATTTGVVNGVAAPAVTTATDTTTVIAGQLDLSKDQALDANCDGTPDTAYSQAQITTGAVPGACVRYRITATNVGTSDVDSVVITDATPQYTVYDDGSRNSTGAACATGAVDAGAATTIGTVTAPACDASGTVTATVGTLTPSPQTGSQAVLTFGVMILK